MKYDAIIVGAGFAGLYMLHKLRGLGFSARVLEVADGVGGTWYWNRYPGARCDVQSLDYSFSFSDPLQQEWDTIELHSRLFCALTDLPDPPPSFVKENGMGCCGSMVSHTGFPTIGLPLVF